MSSVRLPPDFKWERSFYAGNYHDQWFLYIDGSRDPIAAVGKRLDGIWLSTINRHYEWPRPQKTSATPSRKAALRWAEWWACAHEKRLRREVKPSPPPYMGGPAGTVKRS